MKKEKLFVFSQHLPIEQAKLLETLFEEIIYLKFTKDFEHSIQRLNASNGLNVLTTAEYAHKYVEQGHEAYYFDEDGVLEQYDIFDDEEMSKGCMPITIMIMLVLLFIVCLIISITNNSITMWVITTIIAVITAFSGYKFYLLTNK